MAGDPGRVVLTNDGHEVSIDAALWEASPVLRDSSQAGEQPFEVDFPKEDVDLLLKLHREKSLPPGLNRTYALLAMTVELQLGSFTRVCLKHLFRIPDFWRIVYPDWIPDEAVLACFRASLNRLYRSEMIYRYELDEIMKEPHGYQQKALLYDALKEKIREFVELELDPVPVKFIERCVPIFIINYRGRPETAIYFGGKCTPFELFGKHFDLSKVEIDAFYLKYASYVLFKSRRKVFWKDLRQPTEARLMKENCTFFISREDDVFIVTEEDSECLIWEWIEKEGHDGSFALRHRTPDKISSLDLEPSPEKRLLVLKDNGRLLIGTYKNPHLYFSGIAGDICSAWFYGRQVLAFKAKSGEGSGIEMSQLRPYWDFHDTAQVDINRERFKALAESGRVFPLGRNLCRISAHAIELFNTTTDVYRRALINSEHYVASSELFLHP